MYFYEGCNGKNQHASACGVSDPVDGRNAVWPVAGDAQSHLRVGESVSRIAIEFNRRFATDE
jgi:hypothetical protein